MQDPPPPIPRNHLLGVLPPLLVGLAILALALAMTHRAAPRYRVTTYAAVIPTTSASLDESAGLFDSLSKGQIVATAGTIISQGDFLRGVQDAEVEAVEVTPSAVLAVSVNSPDKDRVRQHLDTVITRATPVVDAGIRPYLLRRLPQTTGPVQVGPSRSSVMLLSLLAAALGAAVVAALQFVLRRRYGRPTPIAG